MERLYLTRRNLQTLLSKLDRARKGEFTTRTIVKHDRSHPEYPQTMDACTIVAIEDDAYYTDRKPGAVHPSDLKGPTQEALEKVRDAMIKTNLCVLDRAEVYKIIDAVLSRIKEEEPKLPTKFVSMVR